MSVKLARRVIDSALPPRLKLTAVVLAFVWADDFGDGVYASIGHMAHLLGKAPRHVRADVADLIKLKVLVPVTARTGGRHRTTRYRLAVEALPWREPWDVKRGRQRPGIETPNPDDSVRVSDPEPGPFEHETRILSTETRTFSTLNPDASVRRSESDQKERLERDQSAPSARILSIQEKPPKEEKTAENDDDLGERLAHLDRMAAAIGVSRTPRRPS